VNNTFALRIINSFFLSLRWSHDCRHQLKGQRATRNDFDCVRGMKVSGEMLENHKATIFVKVTWRAGGCVVKTKAENKARQQ
jgi:hypothetical protein